MKRVVEAVLAGSALALCVASPGYAAVEFSVLCAELDESARDELVARARLLLQSAETQPATLRLACDGEDAWLYWNDGTESRIRVDTTQGIIEGTLDAIDAQLSSQARNAASGAEWEDDYYPEPRRFQTLQARAKLENPFADQQAPQRPTPVFEASPEPGGIALSTTLELWPAPFHYAIGPRFDVAVGSGSWVAIASEGMRVARPGSGLSYFQFEAQLGAGYGAPFVPDHLLGANLVFGAEWLSRASEGSVGRAALAPTTTLGLRAAHNFGRLSFWVGTDLRLRLLPYETTLSSDATMSTFTVAFLVGGALLVDGGKKNGP